MSGRPKVRRFGYAELQRVGTHRFGSVGVVVVARCRVVKEHSRPLNRLGVAGAQSGPPYLLPALRFWRQKRST